MNDLNLKAARIQLRALIAALVIAILIAVGITAGAFVLSFAVQRDLALQAGIPQYLTWIFPAIVDGAIFGATISVVALSKISGSAAGKRFFLWLAVVVVFISVFGNAYHAHRAGEAAARNVAAGIELGYTPLTPTGASLIAIIPPLLVLAFTHGVGILIRAIGTAHSEYSAVVNAASAAPATVDHTPEHNAEAETVHDPAPMRHQTESVARAHDVAPVSAVATAPIAEAADSAPRATSAVAAAELVFEDQTTVAAAVEPAVAAAPEPVVADADSVAEVADLGERGVARNALDEDRNALDEDSQEIYVLPDEEQTIENLLDFIDSCDDFEPVVKDTARLRITENLSYAEIAGITRAKAASTAMRRFDKVAQRAVEAGFRTPPLPEVDDATDNRNAATPDLQYALVGAR
ncbi:DUF2637 domain-containing protein [Rhodococcus sp. ACS1]|uniref:DUF2637 domain-containing protein n=1 Tax=Rhodococcus TaxID=1827 RepID=UPI0006BB51EE|nr:MULTISPECIES: DUF2637 domain-containing protein [Rhodococcus]PBC35121.1 DUF2637 domain-containing protein [Rhodococcus sp. ACS1]